MAGDDRAQVHTGAEEDGIDWERWERSLRRSGFLLRTFGIGVGASLAAQALVGLVRWLRRAPGT